MLVGLFFFHDIFQFSIFGVQSEEEQMVMIDNCKPDSLIKHITLVVLSLICHYHLNMQAYTL